MAEQGLFQFGALLLAGFISGLGTASIAADSVARGLADVLLTVAQAFNVMIMMVIGRCMGAGDTEKAKMYIKHILKMEYAIDFVWIAVFLLLLKPLISLFQITGEVQGIAFWLMIIYTSGVILLYPSSFATASALRGAADTKFVMIVAVFSVFLFRIGTAYLLNYVFSAGVYGVWIAMTMDWLIRSAVFAVRLKRGKWEKNRII